MAYQTVEEPAFNPLVESRPLRCRDVIRSEHRHPDQDKLWTGAVLCSAAGRVYFWYGEHRYFDQLQLRLQELRTRVVQPFQGITIDSFLEAKALYQKTGRIETIDHYLANPPRRDLE